MVYCCFLIQYIFSGIREGVATTEVTVYMFNFICSLLSLYFVNVLTFNSCFSYPYYGAIHLSLVRVVLYRQRNLSLA